VGCPAARTLKAACGFGWSSAWCYELEDGTVGDAPRCTTMTPRVTQGVVSPA
jgi:hypothetical protein